MQYDVILSGPIAGDPEFRAKFAQAVVTVRQKWHGCSVWNPAMLDQERPYKWCIRQCVNAIMNDASETCVLVLLKGWNRSPGGVMEWALCRCLGMRIVEISEI
jgi:hypothetical protein